MKTIYTIGFTQKTLQQFIERLRSAGVRETHVSARCRRATIVWCAVPDVAVWLPSICASGAS
ncbi:MAG: hypothetical protein RMM98_03180 [Acidobacteriota bacterium]|nr:hypothetical protein [Blastocatellia bacterium]MDW8238596.1 hypothetical protein [Acidobacteriota bacterium]